MWIVLTVGCRYRLVVDGKGSRLTRTLLGVPWSWRSFGRRPRVAADIGWDFDELVIVQDHPCPERFAVMDASFYGWSFEDCDATAGLANREIDRITIPKAPPGPPYRSPPVLS
ncbi:Hypothetical protein A7982_08443 [Minicystis rosea]|nr:Hypothetical protein A7982_08443 [Minicystis rosea]